jgi:hypothetical protein
MTETLGHPDGFGYALKRLVALMGRAGFFLFIIAAVGIALIATTFIGLMLAVAAVFLSIAYQLGRGSRRAPSSGDNSTLEARRTGDGWVIEPNGNAWR